MEKTILIWTDSHFPFHSDNALKEIAYISKEIKPDVIIHLGDIYDMYSASKFPRTHNLMTPKQEIREARALANMHWKQIRAGNLKAQCYQVRGNHDVRPNKRIMEAVPELESIIDIMDLWKFEGVNLIEDHREELVVDGIIFIHGHRKPGTHFTYNNAPTVVGHSHKGYVLFKNAIKNQVIWELNAGFTGDINSIPLSYRNQKYSDWTLGCGVIDKYGPRFISL